MPQRPASRPNPALQRRPVVYLIASPSVSRDRAINLTPAYDHGEVQVIVPPGESPTFKPNLCMDLVEQRLDKYDPTVDFLLWAGGDALAALMAGMVLANRDIWCFQWLRYERRRLPDGRRVDEGAKYIPITINLSNLDGEQDGG